MAKHTAKFPGFSETQADEILEQAKRFWADATNAMEPLFSMIEDCERLWRVQLPVDLENEYASMPDLAALAPADAHINIKSLRAQLRKTLFAKKPYANLSFAGRPNIRSDILKKAQWTLQAMLDEQSDGRGFEYEFDRVTHQALYAGISCLYTKWVQRYEKIAIRDEDGNFLLDKNGQTRFRQEAVNEYAESKALDIRRVRIDPAAECREDIRIVGFHAAKNLSELLILREQASHYHFDTKEIMATTFDRDAFYRYAKGETTRYADKGRENEGFADKLIEVQEIRGIFRFEDSGGNIRFEDLVVVIANREKLIALKRNDLPIDGWELFDFPSVDHELSRLFGLGVIEPMMDAIVEKFIKRNQSIDEANRRTYDVYIGDKAACADLPDNIEFSRGLVLKIDTAAASLASVGDALRALEKPNIGQDTFRQAASLGQEITIGMGRNAYRGDGNSDGVESATGVIELVSGADSLLEQMAKNLCDSAICPAWRKQLILYNFFKGHKESIVHDQQGKALNIEPGEINFLYKVDLDISTALDTPVMVRRWIEQYPTMLQDPFLDPYEVRRTNLEILGLPNPEKLLPPNEYIEMVIERENIALARGVQLPVHPLDQHQGHVESHLALIDELQRRRIDDSVAQEHLDNHLKEIEKQNKGLANTKETGAASGQIVNSGNAAIKSVPGVGGQRVGVS